jgi:hypothetical protein
MKFDLEQSWPIPMEPHTSVQHPVACVMEVTTNTVNATLFIYYPLLEDVLLLRHVSDIGRLWKLLYLQRIRCFGSNYLSVTYNIYSHLFFGYSNIQLTKLHSPFRRQVGPVDAWYMTLWRGELGLRLLFKTRPNLQFRSRRFRSEHQQRIPGDWAAHKSISNKITAIRTVLRNDS